MSATRNVWLKFFRDSEEISTAFHTVLKSNDKYVNVHRDS